MPDASLNSCLYAGHVVHQRFGPLEHRLEYRVYSLLIDLDEFDALERLKLFSIDRFNLFGFRTADFGSRDGTDLKNWANAQMDAAALKPADRIRILCFPRVLGSAFNPLAIWFCHDADDQLVAILYQVSNTFGEHHTYVIPADNSDRVQRHGCAKNFHVSPFFDVAGDYKFRIAAPDDHLSVMIRYDIDDERQLIATQTGKRIEISDSALMKQLVSHPHLTAKVLAGIHWEAAKLWWKGAGYRSRPEAPSEPVTIVSRTRRTDSAQAAE